MNKLLIAALAGLAASAAQAQLVVGNDQSGTATIYNIDVGTGAATPIYSTSASTEKPWGMAYDPATNTLWWNSGGNLYRSPYGNPLTPTLVGVLNFNGTNINFVALAWHNGQLLGTRNIATEAVYSVDTSTAVCTQVYVYPSTFDFGGLDVDVTTDKLYGLNDAAGAPGGSGLYEINPTSQSATFIAGYPAGETDIDGLAVYDGKAYYITDGPNTTQASFYIVDIATGNQIGTLPSPFTGSGTFSAATYIAPAPPACYPDCDGVGGLTGNDFACFLNAFTAGQSYADCDGVGGLTGNDFACFLNAFTNGCS